MDSHFMKAYQAIAAAYHVPFVMQSIELENEFLI